MATHQYKQVSISMIYTVIWKLLEFQLTRIFQFSALIILVIPAIMIQPLFNPPLYIYVVVKILLMNFVEEISIKVILVLFYIISFFRQVLGAQ